MKNPRLRKMADVHFLIVHWSQNSLKKANGCILRDIHMFYILYYKISRSSLGDLVSSLFSNFHFILSMHSRKMFIHAAIFCVIVDYKSFNFSTFMYTNLLLCEYFSRNCCCLRIIRFKYLTQPSTACFQTFRRWQETRNFIWTISYVMNGVLKKQSLMKM